MTTENAVQSGSAPVAAATNPDKGSTVQPESVASRTQRIISEELAAIKKPELKKESASVEESSKADEDDEKLEAEATEEDSDESESEDDDDQEANIPRSRLNKEIEKTRKAKAKVSELEEMITTLQEKVTAAEEVGGKASTLQGFVDYVIEAAEYMPEIASIMKHPVFAGTDPKLEHFESPEKYAEWREKQAEKRFSKSSEKQSGEKEIQQKIDQTLDAWDKEIDDLRKDAMWSKFMDEDHLVEVRKFIEEQALTSLASGSQRFDSIKKIVKFLYSDDVVEALKKSGAEEAVKKIDAGKKKVSLKSKGTGAPVKTPLKRPKTITELIRETIEESRAV